MHSQLIALAIIAGVSFLSPYIASLIPGNPIPETVFLVFAGAALGPFGLSIIPPFATHLEFLSELGLAFLFLLAGYEIDIKKLTGPMGAHASLSWLISLGLALILMLVLPTSNMSVMGALAVAIAMTTTAYGTVAPILRERELTGTDVGDAVTVYGAIGELLPVLALTILLTTRGTVLTVGVLLAFCAICASVIFLPKAAKNLANKILYFLEENAETGSQAPVRLTVFLLITLIAISAIFHLDAVLGAFAAGFILRATMPEGNHLLESKLEAIAYGFLVPTFFVVSGAAIDMSAVMRNPSILIKFMLSLLLVRTVPVMIFLKHSEETAHFTYGQRISTAIYCTMALPLIVAVTSIAVSAQAMSADIASVLVGAGALTVLIVPIVTNLTIRIGAAHPIEAVKDIWAEPDHATEIMHEHVQDARYATHSMNQLQEDAREEGYWISSCDYLARCDIKNKAWYIHHDLDDESFLIDGHNPLLAQPQQQKEVSVEDWD